MGRWIKARLFSISHSSLIKTDTMSWGWLAACPSTTSLGILCTLGLAQMPVVHTGADSCWFSALPSVSCCTTGCARQNKQVIIAVFLWHSGFINQNCCVVMMGVLLLWWTCYLSFWLTAQAMGHISLGHIKGLCLEKCHHLCILYGNLSVGLPVRRPILTSCEVLHHADGWDTRNLVLVTADCIT